MARISRATKSAWEGLLSGVDFTGPPTFYRCETGWDWKPRALTDYDLWCVLEGRGILQVGDEPYSLSPGDCFVLAPGSRPHGTHDDSNRLLVFAVHFDFATRERIPPFWRKPQHTALRDISFFQDMAQRCETSFRSEGPLARERSRLFLRQLLMQFWEEAQSTPPSPTDAKLAEIVRAIRQDPGAKWHVEDMANRANRSPSQFSRRFSALTGMSPAHFVIQTRLDRARHLLSESDMTVGAIADALGYHDVHFFCRQFKAFTGRTPGALRESAHLKAEAAATPAQPVTPEDIAQYRLFSFK